MNAKVISITFIVLLFIVSIFFIRTKIYYKNYRFESLLRESRYKYSDYFQLKINGQLIDCKDSTCKEIGVSKPVINARINRQQDVQSDYLNILSRYTDINMVMEGAVKDSILTIESEWFTISMTFLVDNDTLIIQEIQIEEELACNEL